jgi:hypothetical protein
MSALQHFSTLSPPGFACQHGGFAALSASQPGLAQAKAEMLTSDSRRLERAD